MVTHDPQTEGHDERGKQREADPEAVVDALQAEARTIGAKVEELVFEAEGRGGIEAVDFLNQIRDYTGKHGIPAVPSCWPGGDVWEDEAGSSIRVCIRKRPMLRIEQMKHDFDVISAEVGHASLVVHEPKTKVGPRSRAAHTHSPKPQIRPVPPSARSPAEIVAARCVRARRGRST